MGQEQEQRLKLHYMLTAIPGPEKVYFQPPATVSLAYPCLIYKRVRNVSRYADNQRYYGRKMYQVTVIDRNPDSYIPSEIEKLPFCEFTSHFTADGLNHDVFNIYI